MQKTSYEMRISDWSSDVCSSDLEFFTCLVEHRRAFDAGRRNQLMRLVGDAFSVSVCHRSSPYENRLTERTYHFRTRIAIIDGLPSACMPVPDRLDRPHQNQDIERQIVADHCKRDKFQNDRKGDSGGDRQAARDE